MTDGLDILKKIYKIRAEKKKKDFRNIISFEQNKRMQQGIFPAPSDSFTTQRTFEKTGLRALLNKSIDNPAYNFLVNQEIAPEMKDKSYWGRISESLSFPLKKVLSAGMATPRATSTFAREAVSQAKGGITPGTFFPKLLELPKQAGLAFFVLLYLPVSLPFRFLLP